MRTSLSTDQRRAYRGGLSLLLTGLLAILLAWVPAERAAANDKYAAFIMDADSGEVLYARSADLHRYPASLTKMMTLYLLFEELEAGRLTMSSKLKASAHAAGQAPSKLGIKAGESITVEAAIKALIVRSANDIAVVVGESIGGSESAFARLMTEKARALGMSKTTFRNASGLPDSGQKSTARDMATLGRRLLRDFPQYADYFSAKSFTWGSRTWTTHNHLLKLYEGTDGLKTGYTRASGFNVTTSVHRNGHHLIGVVMGGRTAKTRDREMIRIMDLTFGRLKVRPEPQRQLLAAADFVPRPKPKLGPSEASQFVAGLLRETPMARLPEIALPSLAASALTAANPPAEADDGIATLIMASALAPRPGPTTPAAVTPAPVEGAAITPRPDPAPAVGVLPEPKPVEIVLTLASLPGEPPRPRDIGALIEAEAETGIGGPEAPAAEGETPDRLAALDEGDGGPWTPALPEDALAVDGWGIQIGAFADVAAADRELRTAATVAPSLTMSLSGVMPVELDGDTLFRARFGPIARADAAAACAQLSAAGLNCFPVQDTNWDTLIRR
ncbi:MAG: SPOR domain-containing protein [Alphaproteobacteria bacterium]|nr:SPOR domain-containing protein [Alphaproteobacteria bacterium]